MAAGRPTLDDVARAAGVSRMTVSNAYNRPDQLSVVTRERVLDAARSLGYAGPDPASAIAATRPRRRGRRAADRAAAVRLRRPRHGGVPARGGDPAVGCRPGPAARADARGGRAGPRRRLHGRRVRRVLAAARRPCRGGGAGPAAADGDRRRSPAARRAVPRDRQRGRRSGDGPPPARARARTVRRRQPDRRDGPSAYGTAARRLPCTGRRVRGRGRRHPAASTVSCACPRPRPTTGRPAGSPPPSC